MHYKTKQPQVDRILFWCFVLHIKRKINWQITRPPIIDDQKTQSQLHE